MPIAGFAKELRFLQDRWDSVVAGTLDPVELLRYRSNLLGSDARITAVRTGSTSAKLEQRDPINGSPVQVLWVKGASGDLAQIKRAGFASVYLDLFQKLESMHRKASSDESMSRLYPLVSLGTSSVAASAETPLHAFLPFAHVDHLRPGWGAEFANATEGQRLLDAFNERGDHHVAWLPWQRSDFKLGLELRKLLKENPGCTGVTLGGRSWMTWGSTSRECYLNSITLMDHLGQFVEQYRQVQQPGTQSLSRPHQDHFLAEHLAEQQPRSGASNA